MALRLIELARLGRLEDLVALSSDPGCSRHDLAKALCYSSDVRISQHLLGLLELGRGRTAHGWRDNYTTALGYREPAQSVVDYYESKYPDECKRVLRKEIEQEHAWRAQQSQRDADGEDLSETQGEVVPVEPELLATVLAYRTHPLYAVAFPQDANCSEDVKFDRFQAALERLQNLTARD